MIKKFRFGVFCGFLLLLFEKVLVLLFVNTDFKFFQL